MHYSNILAKFLRRFPSYQETIVQWEPMNKHRIKVKLNSGQKLIFAYHSDTEWTLRTTTKIEED